MLTAETHATTTLMDESFSYAAGPLSGQGEWTRGVTTPAADNPSNHLVVEQGSVQFDWTITQPINNAVRRQWESAQLTEGRIYAAFDFRATQAPQPATDARPGFLSFDRSGGGQMRGIVGLRRGTEAGTVQLGVSSSSQAASSFAFAELDLQLDATYRIILGYDIETARTELWIDAADTGSPPAAFAVGNRSDGVRRVQLRLYNTDGGTGTTNLGIFHIDNLLVYSAPAGSEAPPPDPDPVDPVILPSADKVFLFLLIGQSNMAGRGMVEAEDLVGDPRIAVFNRNRQWEVAREPLHWDRPGFNGVGPGLAFARALLPLLPDDAVIGLIPAAQGGTPISQWERSYSGSATYYDGQYLYHHALSRAVEAAQAGTLAGILWNQGENDASAAENDGGNSYRTRLHRLIADLRSDLNVADLPFIASTLGPWRTQSNAINQVFLSLPEAVPHTATVNTLNPDVAPFLVNNPSDPAHYVSASYRLLGQLYAQAYAGFLPTTVDTPEAPLLHIESVDGGVLLRWNQPAQQPTHLETSDQLQGPWSTMQSFAAEPTVVERTVMDGLPTPGSARFYRLRIEPGVQ